jgi:hypothetical protein
MDAITEVDEQFGLKDAFVSVAEAGRKVSVDEFGTTCRKNVLATREIAGSRQNELNETRLVTLHIRLRW